MPVLDERDVTHAGKKACSFRAEENQEVADFHARYYGVAKGVLA